MDDQPERDYLYHDRFHAYRRLVRDMRAGMFDVQLQSSVSEDVTDSPGADLKDLGRWLDQQFAAFQRLQEIAEYVGRGLLLEEVLDRIFIAFRPLLPYNRLGCALLTADRERLVARWARTDYAEPKILPGYSGALVSSSLKAVLDSGRPRIINDLPEYGRAHPESGATRLALAEGIRSSFTCPLVSDGTPLGCLFFSSFDVGTYARVHQELYLRVAGQVATLVAKGHLYERILQLSQELTDAHDHAEVTARTDQLTGIPNRRALYERLQHLHAAGGVSRHAVLVVDVDHFKRVNDEFGHLAGDLVLRGVVTRLQGCLPSGTLLGRLGGEEFLAVMSTATTLHAEAMGEQLRAAVSASAIEIAAEPHRLE